jgi:hypothetical protein
MAKFVRLKSKSKIIVSSADFLAVVNGMREEYGDESPHKTPIDINEAVNSHRVLVDRDDDFGVIGIGVHYKDGDGIGCVRNYPKSGLVEDSGDSKIELVDGVVEIYLDYKITAGKSKWQKAEVDELSKILQSSEFEVSLNLTLSNTVEWGGHTSLIKPASSEGLGAGGAFSSEFFIVEIG